MFSASIGCRVAIQMTREAPYPERSAPQRRMNGPLVLALHTATGKEKGFPVLANRKTLFPWWR